MAKQQQRKGPNFITQADIARSLGVSRSTVAAALNPDSPIRLKAQTAGMVRRAALRMNYQPHQQARVMRVGRSRTIGVLIGAQSRNDVHYKRMRGLAKTFRAAGYDLIVTSPEWYVEGVRDAVRWLQSVKVEGIILASCTVSKNDLAGLIQAQVPMLTLSGTPIDGLPDIGCDIEKAFQQLTRHVLTHRRRKLVLAVSTSFDSPDAYKQGKQSTAKARGFCRAILGVGGRIAHVHADALGADLRERILIQNDSRSVNPLSGEILTIRSPMSEDPFLPGKAAMRTLLERSELPDAMICTNDEWALGAMSEGLRLGLKFPTDMALTGFDDSPLSTIAPVPLTSAAQPLDAMVRTAGDTLLDRIEGRLRGGRARRVKLPCTLVIRESCGEKPT